MQRWNRLAVMALFMINLLVSASLAAAGDDPEFPLRAKYPSLTPIETEELAANFDTAVVVDSRNTEEYAVVHVLGAKNILVGKMQEADLLALRPKTGDPRLLVFYCNGTTCAKSYKAAEKAAGWGFDNVRVYDPGIFFWAKAQPERAELFGKKLDAESVKTAFIPKEKFEAALVPPADFLAKVASGSYTVIDVRDPNEQSEIPMRLPKTKVLTVDTLVGLLEKKSPAVPRSGLLIFDNVGHQVMWVQYYLEKEGITDYFFLKGGVRQLKEEGYDATGKKG
ncbi:MAG: rhodanese-like domain-containing protein [Thermodesulfobacteriota bacterium]